MKPLDDVTRNLIRERIRMIHRKPSYCGIYLSELPHDDLLLVASDLLIRFQHAFDVLLTLNNTQASAEILTRICEDIEPPETGPAIQQPINLESS